MAEYATLAHPNIPRIIPTANINQTIVLLAFSDIESPPNFLWYSVKYCSTRCQGFLRFNEHRDVDRHLGVRSFLLIQNQCNKLNVTSNDRLKYYYTREF